MASSLYGIPRLTNDVDIVLNLSPDRVADLVDLIRAGFHVDGPALEEAFRLGRPYNVFYREFFYKFDLYPLGADLFSQSQLARTSYRTFAFFGKQVEFAVASAEDTILAKLRWYRMGGEASTQQWRDAQEIVAVMRGRLDLDYLNTWAERIGVSDLAARLIG